MTKYLEDAVVVWNKFSSETGSEEWIGSVTETGKELEFSKARFDRALKFLKVSGCIEFIRSGNRYGETRLRLDHPPTENDSQIFSLTEAQLPGRLEQRVNDLAKLIGGVNLVDLEARITLLEQKLNITKRG